MTRDDIEITIPNSVIANAKIINESGGGGGIGTAIKLNDGSGSIFSYVDAEAIVNENITFDVDNAGINSSFVVTVIPKVTVANGIGMTVGTGKTMVIDALQLGGL